MQFLIILLERRAFERTRKGRSTSLNPEHLVRFQFENGMLQAEWRFQQRARRQAV